MATEADRKRMDELPFMDKVKASFSGYEAEAEKKKMINGKAQLDALKQRKASQPTG